MMYVEFIKNFFLADSRELMGVRVISGLLSLKTFDSHFLDMMYLELIKSFFSPIRANWWVLESFRPPEPKNVWFPLSRHDVPRVHEKFFLADSSELICVRVISAFLSPKNFWFILLRHDVPRVHEKFFLALIWANWWVLESFRPPEPKNVRFPLSRHDVRRVYKKFFLDDSRERMGVTVISASWAQKRLIPTF